MEARGEGRLGPYLRTMRNARTVSIMRTDKRKRDGESIKDKQMFTSEKNKGKQINLCFMKK